MTKQDIKRTAVQGDESRAGYKHALVSCNRKINVETTEISATEGGK